MAGAHKDIEVARIGARQAVIVALITAASTFIVTAIGSYFAYHSKTDAASQTTSTRQINLLNVEIREPDVDSFRLTIEVNGYTYSYPTRTLWADVRNPSLPAVFPIVEASEYYVVASGWIRLRDGSAQDFGPNQGGVVHVKYGDSEVHFTSSYRGVRVAFQIQ